MVSLSFVELKCSNTKSGEPVLFWIFFFACLQVIPSSSPCVMIEQLLVMLESGSTVMGFVYWHPGGQKDDFIPHLTSVADEAPIQ